ncbi:MAG: secondary thiamine-phosphate synthase enzyme YjbQ [Coriobacteriia bacterium]|nr:secondary thiamine-phosphate synthase enzyme YjbQ [Coriobacteriia bacterium]
MRFEVRTNRRDELVDVTSQVAEVVAASGVEAGIAVVSSPHTTAGVTVNENADPDVQRDVLHGLQRIFPREGDWRHFEGNSDAHLKTALVGTSATLPVAGGRLALGTWQAIYLAEFDGPRTRKVDVTVVSGVG